MFNQLIIIGNLTRDPDLRTVHSAAGDIPVCNFTVAVNDYRQPRRNGEVVPQFIRITVWREQAEKCSQHLAKGRMVACVGPVSHRRQEVNGTVYADMEMQNAQVYFMPSGRSNQDAAAQVVGQVMAQSIAQTVAQPAVQPDYDAAPYIPDATVIDDDNNDLPF